MERNLKKNSSAWIRLLVLFVVAFVGLLITSVTGLLSLVMSQFGAMVSMVLAQDVLVFIVPAIVAAYWFYHRPWRQLALDRGPSWRALLLVILVCVVSMPALNFIVKWNEGLHLPESMAAIEQSMRDSEDMAQNMVKMMLAEPGWGARLAVLFTVGVMAGVSEEMFFRGGMLRMLRGGGRSHLAIWTIALVFSAMHMQFFGFFPRMLLGAWLGYLLVWTRSLWVPIIAHSLNNSIVVVASWLSQDGIIAEGSLDNLGVPADGSFPLMALVSAIATVAIIVALRPFVWKNERDY